MCLQDALCSGDVENLPEFKAGTTCSLIMLVPGVLKAVEPHCVPKCGYRSLYWSSQLMVVLLCRTRVGLAEEVTSHSPARTCLTWM